MNTRIVQPRKAEAGGALLVTLLIVTVIGVSLGSYLSLVSSQNRSVMRSLAWNSTVPAMEAGVEEALAHLQFLVEETREPIRDWNRLGASGWVRKSDGWYQKSVHLGGGHAYVTRIEPVEPPNIVSLGVLPAPLQNGTLDSREETVLAAAVDPQSFVQRAVRVGTRREALFAKAMVADGQIDLSGNNVSSDSFNSEDPNYSTGGKYDPDQAAGQRGYRNQFRAGELAEHRQRQHHGNGIHGAGRIGQHRTEWQCGDGRVGRATGTPGIEPGRVTDDMNVSFDPV
jgi:hypothetical protein